MSDSALRALERRVLASGRQPVDDPEVLSARLRAGLISREVLEHMGFAGHEAAREALGPEFAARLLHDREWRRERRVWWIMLPENLKHEIVHAVIDRRTDDYVALLSVAMRGDQ